MEVKKGEMQGEGLQPRGLAGSSRTGKRQVFSMATNPVSTGSSWNWPSRDDQDDQDVAAWQYRHYAGEIVEIKSIAVQIDIADVYQGLDFADSESGEG